MNSYKIGELLTRIKDVVLVEDNIEYKRITIKSKNQGVFLRDIVKGSKIGTKRQFLAKEGQFIMSRIDARNGAFGIIPVDLEGAIMTNDFLTFEVNHELVNIDYFNMLTESSQFMKYCIDGSKGTTNRKRLKEELFLNFEIKIPNKEEQDIIVKNINSARDKHSLLKQEFEYQQDIINKLRSKFLSDAIQGVLTSKDKEKYIPEDLVNDEFVFGVPKDWKWMKLNDLGDIFNGNSINARVKESKYAKVKTGLNYIGTKDVDTKTSSIPDYNTGVKIPFDETAFKIAHRGAILICAEGGSAGKKLAMAEEDICFGNKLFALEPNESVLSEYVYHVYKSTYFKDRFNSLMTGIIGGVSIGKFKNILIPVPPIEEQSLILSQINQLMNYCNSLEEEVQFLINEALDIVNSMFREQFNADC